MTKNNKVMMLQLPYSPDLAPCDFFSKNKKNYKKVIFCKHKRDKIASLKDLEAISKT